jgi:hypothetical protein
VVQCFIATAREILDQSPCPPTLWRGEYPTEKKNATQWEDLAMEHVAIVSILSALLVQLPAAKATAEGNYKKICRVSENLRVLDDSADANSCRAIAVQSQALEYQIGCRDSENTGTIIVTAPFHITDKAARVTSSKLAAHAQNTATPEQFAQCAKAWGSR